MKLTRIDEILKNSKKQFSIKENEFIRYRKLRHYFCSVKIASRWIAIGEINKVIRASRLAIKID